MEEGETADHLTTIVDREVARENVQRLAQSQGYVYRIEEIAGEFHIHMSKTAKSQENPSSVSGDLVILVKSNLFGEGEQELGEVLMKGFLYTLNELESNLKSIIFMNKGIYLTLEDSPVLEQIRNLEKIGVEVLSCGTCLDYYQKTDKLASGKITNMYTAVETMAGAVKTITI
jgi:selenium metabolism protein YedF